MWSMQTTSHTTSSIPQFNKYINPNWINTWDTIKLSFMRSGKIQHYASPFLILNKGRDQIWEFIVFQKTDWWDNKKYKLYWNEDNQKWFQKNRTSSNPFDIETLYLLSVVPRSNNAFAIRYQWTLLKILEWDQIILRIGPDSYTIKLWNLLSTSYPPVFDFTYIKPDDGTKITWQIRLRPLAQKFDFVESDWVFNSSSWSFEYVQPQIRLH